ncbi:MAG: hypothetical protein KAQ64_03675 [Candidatus Pacebacteria bacterium]|nr:hypothetical protein [Candidatus Paceibacterota bacterium]
MENDDQNKIYIKKDEEIPSIISRIKKREEKEIILIVPHNALILNNVLNLKILKKEAEDLNKNISVITASGNNETRSESVEAKSDIAGSGKKNLVSSVMKADDFQKFKKDKDADISFQKGNEFSARSSFENKDKTDLSNDSNNAETGHEKKVKMFDIVKKVNNLDEIGDKDYKHDAEKIKNNKADDHQESFKDGGDDIKPQMKERVMKPVQKASKKTKTTILPLLSSKIVALFIFISFVAVSLAVAFILPKADINIVLKKEVAVYDFEFTADASLDKIDAVNNKIPLETIEISSEESGNYPATGKKHVQKKASGEITVFNEYSSSPQRLVATTRFLSKTSGKLFRIKEAVTIPGFSRVEGVDVPGQVTIRIYADKFGEEYNIGADSFHLPKLQEIGSPKYTSIYARSIKSMSGGMDKEVSYFSESDHITAKEKLVKLAKEKNEKDLLGKISEEVLLLESTKKEEDLEISTDIEVGDIVDSFQMSVKAKTSAFLVVRADLDEIINEKINSRLDTNRKLLDNSRSYEVGEVVINENERIAMQIHIKQGLIVKVDIDKLKKDIAGKSEVELKSYFSNMNGIRSTEVSLWPFWVRGVPSSYEKINITIDINNSV